METSEITNADFFRILTGWKKAPITLLDGYDSETGRVPAMESLTAEQERDPAVWESLIAVENKMRLTVAKSIVCQTPDTQFDYCNYILRLLWMRENWLLPKKAATKRTSLCRETYGRKVSWITDNRYVDIDSTQIVPLFGDALLIFCNIVADPDSLQEIVDMSAKRKHIKSENPIWPSGERKMFYALTDSGKSVVERFTHSLQSLASCGVDCRDSSLPPPVESAHVDNKARNVLIEIIREGVCGGSLKADALKTSPQRMQKETEKELHKTFGLTATDIARLFGATDANVRSKADTIQKRLNRSK